MNALLMVLVLGASDVSLRVEAGTPCLEQRRLASLLVAQGLVMRAGAPLEVLARGTGSSLSLVGTRGAERFARTVPAGVGECAAVERIVVSLINSWAQPLSLALRSEAKVDAGQPAEHVVATAVDAGPLAGEVRTTRDAGTPSALVAVTPARESTKSVGELPSGVGATAVDAGELAAAVQTTRDTGAPVLLVAVEPKSVVVTSRDAGELGAGVRTTRDTGAEPKSVVVTSLDAVGVALEPTESVTNRDAGVLAEGEPPRDGGVASASPLSLTLSPAGGRGKAVVEVSVLGGGAIGPTDTVAGTGSVLVGFSLGRFGAVLDANLETERTKNVADGTAFTTRQWLGLSARAEFLPLETLLLDVTLGVRGTRVIVGGRDYPDAKTAPDLFDFGGTLTGGARVLLFGPVWLEGRAMAGLRTRVTALVLQDPTTDVRTTLLVVQPWDIGLSLGVCARF